MGLFTNPEEIQAAQQAGQNTQALNYAALGADNAGAYLGYRAGQQVGGLLAGPDPATVRSSLVQDALSEVGQNNDEIGTPKYFAALTKALSKRQLSNEALSVQNYAAQQAGIAAKTKLEEGQASHAEQQAAREKQLLGIFSGARPGESAGPLQLSGPGADQQQPSQTSDPYKDPALLRAASTFPGMGHLGAEADRLEKAADLAKRTKDAQDPETGMFSTLYDDPNVGKIARKAQATLTAGHMDLTRAEVLFNTLAARSTSLAAASAARSGNEVNVVPSSVAHLHGDDYLATLNPGMANVVRAIGTYEANPTQVASMRGNNREAMMQRVLQAYPDFKGTEYPARQKLVNDFKAGAESTKIVSANQAIAHIGTLLRLGDDVQNGDSRDLNSLINNISNRTGNPAINNYDLAAQAVAEELMRVFRVVSASETEAANFERKLKSNLAPGQIRGALQTGVELLNGRLQAMNNKWNTGMGTTGGYPGLLSPEAKQVLAKLGVSANKGDASGRQLLGYTPENKPVYRGANGKPEVDE